MKTLLVKDIIGMVDKEQGFFINLHTSHNEFSYTCADDYYEDWRSQEINEKEVLFITTKGEHICIIINY
jgi:hypothetical protein